MTRRELVICTALFVLNVGCCVYVVKVWHVPLAVAICVALIIDMVVLKFTDEW